jgi:hypothetical protein
VWAAWKSITELVARDGEGQGRNHGVEVVNVMSRSSTTNWRGVICSTLCGVVALLSSPLSAQEVEIRRWNHLPIDGNFVTTNYARTDGDIAVDPVLLLDDVSVEMDTWLLGYIRTFELFDRTARVEIRQPWQAGIWNGVVDGTPTQVSREGWSDTFARFAVNLVGAPPLAGKAYADYRAAAHVETIVGAALGMRLPTGQYLEDKLINLGSNRWWFKPAYTVVGLSLWLLWGLVHTLVIKDYYFAQGPGYHYLTPFFSEQVAYESNVFQVPSGSQGDVIFKTIPGFLADFTFGPHSAALGYRAEILNYVTLTSENTVNHIGVAQLRLDFPKLFFNLRNDFTHTSDPPDT